MTDRSRRAILCGTAGLFAFSAGCLDETEDASGNGNPDEGSNGDPDDGADGAPDGTESEGDDSDGTESEGNDSGEEDAPDSGVIDDYDSVPFELDQPRDPDAALLVESDRALDWLAERDLDGEELTDFVDETVFEESVLLGLEAEAPRLDYELELETVAVEDGGSDPTLVVGAAVREASDGMGGTQMITVGRLVRATFTESPATEASVTIVDADGNTHSMGMGVDSASESADANESDGA